MVPIENIRNVFSNFHDGVILAWKGDKALLILTIECRYLAERIDKSFDKFYIELSDIDKIELDPWTNPADIPTIIKTDLSDIFKADLEILSADIKDGKVVVSCNQDDADLGYCGGNLTIDCRAIKVFDHNKNLLTIDQLDKICNDYWEEWRKK